MPPSDSYCLATDRDTRPTDTWFKNGITFGFLPFPRSGRVWAQPNQVSGGSLTKRQQVQRWQNEVMPFLNLLSVLVKTSESRKEPSVRREKWGSLRSRERS